MKRTIIAAFAVCMAFTMCSCGNIGQPDPNTITKKDGVEDISYPSLFDDDSTTPDDSSQAEIEEYSPEEDPEKFIKATIAGMTLEEKVGQLFIVRADALETGYESKVVNDDTIGGVTFVDNMMVMALGKYNVGGVVLKEKNIIDENKLRDMTVKLQDRSKYPLFIGIDEIGGDHAPIANNINFDVPLFENMNVVGDLGDAGNARKLGKSIGNYLVSYGLNLDLAPVADVSEDAEDVSPINFSADPYMVASMAEAEINGLHESGVMTAIGHFPGYGDDDIESKTVPSNDLDWESVMENSGVAFKRSLEKTDMLMVGHILLPSVTDDDLPASMSKLVIEEKIRDELGYKGVIITDAMSAKCITYNYIRSECAVNAIIAGADIVLMPYDLDDSFNAVLKAVEDGKISESRIDKSVERILALKVKRGLFDDDSPDDESSKEDNKE